MKCPRCQSENPDAQKFCGECGSKLEMVCSNCGVSNPTHYKFCGECGHNLTPPSKSTIKELSQRVERWKELITNASEKFSVDHNLVAAVIAQESGGNQFAGSRAGAKGLMQLMPRTARMVARHRPSMPVIAATPNPKTLRVLALVWGVQPVLVGDFKLTDEMIRVTVDAACQAGIVSWGDVIVITAGIPFGGVGKTNFLEVHVVGDLDEA